MAVNLPFQPDKVDAAILKELQANGRQSIADLARRIAMSHSATAERVRRLEEAGVISGYAAQVDPERLGSRSSPTCGCATRAASTSRSMSCSRASRK